MPQAYRLLLFLFQKSPQPLEVVLMSPLVRAQPFEGPEQAPPGAGLRHRGTLGILECQAVEKYRGLTLVPFGILGRQGEPRQPEQRTIGTGRRAEPEDRGILLARLRIALGPHEGIGPVQPLDGGGCHGHRRPRHAATAGRERRDNEHRDRRHRSRPDRAERAVHALPEPGAWERQPRIPWTQRVPAAAPSATTPAAYGAPQHAGEMPASIWRPYAVEMARAGPNPLRPALRRPKVGTLRWHARRELAQAGQTRREARSTRHACWPVNVTMVDEALYQVERSPSNEERGRFVFGEDKVSMADLFKALETDYVNNRRRSETTLKWRLAPLRAAFGEDRAVDVTEPRIERYKADRLASQTRTRYGVGTRRVAPATVNRELTVLKRTFRLAVRQKRLSLAPTIELLEKGAPRQGFLEPADFERVVRLLPAELSDFARFGYQSGWRKGEIRRLSWSDVDRTMGRIVLRREHSKNGEPRVLPLLGDLAALIERRWAAREYQTPAGTTTLGPFVFHRGGEPVGDFRKAWAAACDTAGVAGTLFHVLRRSAVRNMDRAGVSQAVAMRISGHKTASVYRRYRIVAEDDLREALARTQASLATHPPGTVTPLRGAVEQSGG